MYCLLNICFTQTISIHFSLQGTCLMEAAARPNPAPKSFPEAMPQGPVGDLLSGLSTLLQNLLMLNLGGTMRSEMGGNCHCLIFIHINHNITLINKSWPYTNRSFQKLTTFQNSFTESSWYSLRLLLLATKFFTKTVLYCTCTPKIHLTRT